MANTIFASVLKSFLTSALQQRIDESRKEDHPDTLMAQTLDKGLSLFTGGRDLALAQTKQSLLTKLIADINAHEAAGDDLETCKALLRLLKSYKDSITVASSTKGRQSGQKTETLLGTLSNFINTFYQKAKKQKLIDQSHQDDPFSYFLNALTKYHAKRAFDETHPSLYQNLVTHPSITSVVAFQKEIDAIVTQALQGALLIVNTLDKSQEEACLRVKNNQGLQNVEYLILAHQHCYDSKYKLTTSGPFIPLYLNDYLQTARHEIHEKQSPYTFELADDDGFDEIPLTTSQDGIEDGVSSAAAFKHK